MKTQPPDPNPARLRPCATFRKTLALAAIGLGFAGGPRANANLVLEVKPSDFNASAKQWPIANGTLAGDYFACAPWATTPALTSKINSGNGLGYSAVDFTAASTILGGPLCPASLGGANPRTIEAWCFQPTGANGDAQILVDLSRQYGPDNTNFGFSNSGYGHAVQSNPNTVDWNTGNSVRQGNWVHLVASYDGATLCLYVNGTPDKTVAHTYATEAGGSISIGMMRYGFTPTAHSTDNADNWNAYRGYLGSIRVYDEARTAGQVSSDYALGVNYGEAGTGLPKISASAGTGGSISPLGDTFVALNGSQTYAITTTYGYALSAVLVDGTNVPTAVSSGSYTFTNVTADHTIAASWTPLPTISGTVSGPGGPIYSASVSLSTNPDGSSPSFTRQTDASGNYAIAPPSSGTYYLIAGKGGLVTSSVLTVVMSGSSMTAQNFTLASSSGLDPMVNLDAAALSAGPLTSWPNAGSLGGTVDKPSFASAPTVETINGKAAVTFDGSTTFLRASFASPAQITGQSDWSIAYWVYNPSFSGDEYPLGWARNVSAGRAANFGIGNYWRAVDHNGLQMYFSPTPVAAAWQHVAVTYDGGTEKLYLNGVLNQTATGRTLNIYPGDYLTLGTGVEGDGGYIGWAKFSGSISSLQIYDQALTGGEIAGLYTTTFNVTASAGPHGAISPPGTVTVIQGANQTFTFTPDLGYLVDQVTIDSDPPVAAGANYTFTDVQAAHSISVTFKSDPSYDPTLLFALNTDHLGTDGSTIYTWDGLPKIQYPTVQVIGATNWELNVRNDTGHNDGFLQGTYATAIPVSGVTMVMAVKPLRNAVSDGWNSIVDIMYDKLTLGIKNSTGQIVVRRNGGNDSSVGTIPDGQATVLSMTVQTDGSYEVWANGVSMMTGSANGTMTALDPNRTEFKDEPDWANTALLSGMTVGQGNWDQWWAAMMVLQPTVTAPWDWTDFWALSNSADYWGYTAVVPAYKTSISVGRNAPDGWTAFNGNIGDVHVFNVAKSNGERQALEASVATKFGISLGSTVIDYTTWASTKYPGSDLSNPAADLDGDGMSNFQEYAFGLNPTSSSSVNPIAVPLNQSSGTFSYTRTANTGLTYTVWHSTDLVNWASTGATEGTVTTLDGVETVPVTLDSGLLTEPKLFVRVTAQ